MNKKKQLKAILNKYDIVEKDRNKLISFIEEEKVDLNAPQYFHLGSIPDASGEVSSIGTSTNWYRITLTDFNVEALYDFLLPDYKNRTIPHKYLTVVQGTKNLHRRNKLIFSPRFLDEDEDQLYVNTDFKIVLVRDITNNHKYQYSDICICYIDIFIDDDKTTNKVYLYYKKLDV